MRILLLIVLLLGIHAHSTHAMDFRVEYFGGRTFVAGRGKIDDGDDLKLRSFLRSVSELRLVEALAFDSPGGSVEAGIGIARLVRDTDLPVYVFSYSRCASSCFIAFAAARERYVGPLALLGVHRAGLMGVVDEMPDRAGSAIIAGHLRDYGVPPQIVNKFSSTPPYSVTWLHADDMRDMGVSILR